MAAADLVEGQADQGADTVSDIADLGVVAILVRQGARQAAVDKDTDNYGDDACAEAPRPTLLSAGTGAGAAG
ncbi:hypothetical protein J7E96_29350 [Streptomyces sp. ISL-96]|uniref:hypothetical protein n=1 Tax=Streptomyces sp. ISL-96 TaxID=2819191 RepID=UPI001BE5AE92|nr:hypothetical protein [Streptomyces sp. ISL-96]MBT2492542.1 hypothetical protein [Streptomyces sp. ISL-96]